MNIKYELYFLDCETTGLSYEKNEPIELSLYRFSTNEQKTWYIKPLNTTEISEDALRVNGSKLDDLLWKTKEGREKYIEPSKVIADVENWLIDDFHTSEERIMCGHNVAFDKAMLENLWKRCNSFETFPFNKKYIIDTMQIQFLYDICKNEFDDAGYSLFALNKKYGIRNDKAHTAAADTKATVELFNKQINNFKNFK